MISVNPDGRSFEVKNDWSGAIERIVTDEATAFEFVQDFGGGDGFPPGDGGFPPGDGFGDDGFPPSPKVTVARQGFPPPPANGGSGSFEDIVVGTFVKVQGERLADGSFRAFVVEIETEGGEPPFPGGDGPIGLSDAFRTVLEEMRIRLEGEPPGFQLSIEEFRGLLFEPGELELLEILGGSDGLVILEDVSRALDGIFDFGPEPPFPGDGFLPEELISLLFEIEAALTEPNAPQTTPTSVWAGSLPDDLRGILEDIAGEDGELDLFEVQGALGGGPGFPPGPPDLGDPVVIGNVTSVNHEAGTFSVQDEETGAVRTVTVTDATEFFIRFGGPPPGDGFGTFGQTQQPQFGDPFGDPFGNPFGDPFGDPFAGGDPFEGFASFQDLGEGDFVDVFGSEEDDGTISAIAVKIQREFEGGEGGFGAFPIASGIVSEIGSDAFVMEDFGFGRVVVHITDATVFEIQTFDDPFFQREARADARRKAVAGRALQGPDGFGPPGGPDIRTGSFSDLRVDDDIDVFGAARDNGELDADKILIFRGPEQEEPVVIGVVVDIDSNGQIISVEGDDDTPVNVAISSDTVVGIVFFNPFIDAPFDPAFGPFGGGEFGPNFKRAAPLRNGGAAKVTKAKQFDPFTPPPPSPVPGVPLEELRAFADIGLGMQVAVFGEENSAGTVNATFVLILQGGARQRTFEVAARIDFFDQFGGRLVFQPAVELVLATDAQITLANGSTVGTLGELRDALLSEQTFTFEPRFLRVFTQDLPDPDRQLATAIEVLPLGVDPIQGTENLLIRVDDLFGQLRDFDNVISPSPPSPVRVTRETFIAFANESEAGIHELQPGVLVAVEGTEAVFPGQPEGERIASFVTIIGGQQFEIDGRVESVDETARTITLATRPPEPITNQTFFAGFDGREVSPNDFVGLLESADEAVVVVEFNPFGPGVVRLSLLNPDSPRPLRPDEEPFDRFLVSIEDDGEGGRLLVFTELPPFTLGDGIEVLDDTGNPLDLGSLPGQIIFMEGEVAGEQPIVFFAKTFRELDEVFIDVEVGDFDGRGGEDDARLTLRDAEGNEVDSEMRVFLDFLPPNTVRSGAVAENLAPGVHTVKVEVEALGLFDEQEFVILARGSSFRVVSTVPADGDVNVAESGEISITFSEPVQQSGRFINVFALLQPGSDGRPLGGLSLNDDGTTVTIPVELEEDTSYRLNLVGAVGANDQILTEPLTLRFSTGDQLDSFGSISGSVLLAEAATKQSDPIEIVIGEVLAFNENDEFSGEGLVDEQGNFEIPGLSAGTYRLFAIVETTVGPTTGGYDPDGDGDPNGGDVLTGDASVVSDFILPLPFATSAADLVGDDAVSVDFDPASGDDGLVDTTVPPGESFQVAIYAKGVMDLGGFEFQVDYDAEAVTFEGVREDSDLEKNLLQQNGGLVVSIPSPKENSISFSTVILGPTAEQLAQGDGLLGVLKFIVNDRFSGPTEVVVSKVQFSSGGGGVEDVQSFTRGTVNVVGLERQITVVSSADSVTADGVEKATLTVRLFDLDGLALTDGVHLVRFEILGGAALLNGDRSYSESSTNGIASAELTVLEEGEVKILASVEGARPDTVKVIGTALHVIGEGPVGPMALDFGTADGDQAQRILETIPEDGIVTIDLLATEGALAMVGYQFSLLYDVSALTYSSFEPVGLFEGALLIPQESAGQFRGNVAFVGAGVQTTGDAGSIGTLTFTVNEGAVLPTRVTLNSGQFAVSADEQQRLTIGLGGGIIQIGADASGEPTPDFDGDGVVGFQDFIQFAQNFGVKSTDENFDIVFDLNRNGEVDFPDFIAFAAAFGQPLNKADPANLAATKLARSNLNLETGVSLTARSGRHGETMMVSVDLSDAEIVQGYGLTLNYDPAAFELIDVTGAGKSLFSDDGRPALQARRSGEIVLADVLSEGLSGNTSIVQLEFDVLDPTVTGVVEIAEALISDPVGRVRQLGEAAAEMRLLPESFELTQNYPNPFNPETVIPFALPEASQVRLTIYNVLGQQVARLVDDRLSAGFHKISWNGRDEYGRQVASGLYFVRMQASDFRTVRKVMLLK